MAQPLKRGGNEMCGRGGAKEDVAQTHGLFLAAVMKLHKKKAEAEVGDIKCLALTIVCYLWLVPEYKRSKVHLFNPGFLYFYEKESNSGELAVERVVSACALVKSVLWL